MKLSSSPSGRSPSAASSEPQAPPVPPLPRRPQSARVPRSKPSHRATKRKQRRPVSARPRTRVTPRRSAKPPRPARRKRPLSAKAKRPSDSTPDYVRDQVFGTAIHVRDMCPDRLLTLIRRLEAGEKFSFAEVVAVVAAPRGLFLPMRASDGPQHVSRSMQNGFVLSGGD